MSADNGVYILESEGPEFRVAYGSAIENIHWDGKSCDNPNHFNDEEIIKYFGDSSVFGTKEGALKHAHVLSKQHEYLEYGVCYIGNMGRKFPFNWNLWSKEEEKTRLEIYRYGGFIQITCEEESSSCSAPNEPGTSCLDKKEVEDLIDFLKEQLTYLK